MENHSILLSDCMGGGKFISYKAEMAEMFFSSSSEMAYLMRFSDFSVF